VLLAGIIFFANQLFTFIYQKEKDRHSEVFIKEYELYNMLRIVPIHLTLLAAALLRDLGITFESKVVLVVFLLIKTAIDIGMYVCEDKAFKKIEFGNTS